MEASIMFDICAYCVLTLYGRLQQEGRCNALPKSAERSLLDLPIWVLQL